MPEDNSIANRPQVSAAVRAAKQRYSIIGDSPAFVEAIERALIVAPYDISVLVEGESGTGKEFFPKIIHDNGKRKHKKYVAVNCGAIPEGTIDSELFGHVKGAFTGAIADHKGYFEEADGGTIFLDEVAELPLTTQAKLLRVLEYGEYKRMGSNEDRKTDIRVVAATNKDLVDEVAAGRFREDLYYRLSRAVIQVPALRKRGNDILLITRKFSHDFANRNHTPFVTFDDSAKDALLYYPWPGNVRQIKNVIEQIALYHAGETIGREVVEEFLKTGTKMLPAKVEAGSGLGDYRSELQLLFQVVKKMQSEIDELKQRLDNVPEAKEIHLSRQLSDLSRKSSIKTDNPVDLAGVNELMKSANRAGFIDATEVEPEFHEVKASAAEGNHDSAESPAEGQGTSKSLSELERDTIISALKRNGDRRNKTAKELGISERTLYRKINQYKLDSKDNTPKD